MLSYKPFISYYFVIRILKARIGFCLMAETDFPTSTSLVQAEPGTLSLPRRDAV